LTELNQPHLGCTRRFAGFTKCTSQILAAMLTKMDHLSIVHE
jgi:hypothetical protein